MRCRGKSPLRSAHDLHEFRDLFPLVVLVAGRDGVFDAVRHVVTENFLLHTPEGGTNRGELRHDINAVPVLVDHFR